MENTTSDSKNEKPLYKKWWVWLILFVILGQIFKNNDKAGSSRSNSTQSSGSSSEVEMTHRCGRKWDGERDKTYGVYGNYCCERCYVDFYPN